MIPLRARVLALLVLLSVTEGDDKPVKYPAIFARADGIVV